jgi:hypothetical protein
LRWRKLSVWLPICSYNRTHSAKPGRPLTGVRIFRKGRYKPLKADEFAELSTGEIFTRFASGKRGEKMGKRLAKRLAQQDLRPIGILGAGRILVEEQARRFRNVHISHSGVGHGFTMKVLYSSEI